MGKKIRRLGIAVAGLMLGTCSVVSSEYMDLPGFSDKVEAGRTKNGVATVVAGILGQKIYDHAKIDITIKKAWFSDARVTGESTQHGIDTYVPLWLTSAHFTAHNNEGRLEGAVSKSEFDWRVKQSSDDTYEIARWGPKFDSRVRLVIKDGKIEGNYVRDGPNFDWQIKGTYDKQGNIVCEIDGPLCLGITLEGKINREK